MSEVGEFIRGNGIQKKDFVPLGFPCIHYGQIFTHYGFSASVTKSFISHAQARGLRKAQHGDVVIATTAEDKESVAKALVWLGDAEAAVSGDASIFRHQLDPLYAGFLFTTQAFQDAKNRFTSGTKVKRVKGQDMAKIVIPVPSRAEQMRIGRILLAFEELVSDLSSGLPAEISARRKQYEHYRQQLLTFDELVQA